jgi:hypothetical protein
MEEVSQLTLAAMHTHPAYHSSDPARRGHALAPFLAPVMRKLRDDLSPTPASSSIRRYCYAIWSV